MAVSRPAAGRSSAPTFSRTNLAGACRQGGGGL